MRRYRFKLATLCGLFLMGFMELAQSQEHSYTPADIAAGQGVYQANCLGCHGNNGDAIEGAVLSTGRFRYANTDDELMMLIRSGIPNTPMPPHERLSAEEVRTVVAFVRSLPTGGGIQSDERIVDIGSPLAGQTLFFGEGKCDSCHGVDGGGTLLSPDLGNIGMRRSAGSLEDALLDPNAESRVPESRFYRVVSNNGSEIFGKLLNQDTHSVQILSESEELAGFRKNDLREHGFVDSPMPSYRDVLSAQQVADLVAYMLTLREEEAP